MGEDTKFTCHDIPISSTVRIQGRFAIYFEYRQSWYSRTRLGKDANMHIEYIKQPIKTVVVDDNMNVVDDNLTMSIVSNEELFDYMLYVYDNVHRFEELFGVEMDKDILSNKLGIMEQIVNIMNGRFK